MKKKYTDLLVLLHSLDRVIVAFSGGVDSTFLLAAARGALGSDVIAVTGRSASIPTRELEEAGTLAERLGVRHLVVDTGELLDPKYRANGPDRCYHCKLDLFTRLRDVARTEGFPYIIEGSNADDRNDRRPGRSAVAELGVISPLDRVGLTKQEIRALSRARDLPTWCKPAQACLASRIPYGEEIDVERLRRIERAEEVVRRQSIGQVRVRDHGETARIEVAPADLARLVEPSMREATVTALKQLGYRYVTLDMQGYRQGAMNEVLGQDDVLGNAPPADGR
jgi:uncharacterized protein